MGGLVARSACHYGALARHQWLRRVDKIVFVGTPHHGAPFERGGNWVDMLLSSSPYTAPLARLGKIRSAGITDLRFGNLVDEDWEKRDRFERSGDLRVRVAAAGRRRVFRDRRNRREEAGPLQRPVARRWHRTAGQRARSPRESEADLDVRRVAAVGRLRHRATSTCSADRKSTRRSSGGWPHRIERHDFRTRQASFLKVLSNFRGDLAFGHLVTRFDTDDAAAESASLKTLLEFSLCLARTEDQDGVCVTNMRDHLVIVSVEMAGILPVSLVVGGALFRPIAPGKSNMRFHAGSYPFCFFSDRFRGTRARFRCDRPTTPICFFIALLFLSKPRNTIVRERPYRGGARSHALGRRQVVDTRCRAAAAAGRKFPAELDPRPCSWPTAPGHSPCSRLRVRRQDRMGELGRAIGQFVAEDAAHTAAPWRIGKHIARPPREAPSPASPASARSEVLPASLADLPEQRFGFA